MPVTTLEGHQIHVNEEGFLTDPAEWSPDLAGALAGQIGIALTDAHWRVLNFLRQDYAVQGESATIRRVSTAGGIPVKELFTLFPAKPAKKMAYIAGLPKPQGCV
ncbi:TusE/DsrC/DsvC family sulfur relay protein [Nakamurella sp. PAMC28650]|uniref:TusE/DsrC/DsvC family sulfur relay protein n=1 Tax=Nakamurella sp. PAMC28650 TaxID=2762325 RepID=UPI00164DA259|nr:TusE/DsrC/DsvC family sulfur relay protein [Nakamurella sp. PAMC28650]QNK81531.1 TusE/DsrC/DsvC family sulfur relay protein [Nakamurella sp. PAMC28650]